MNGFTRNAKHGFNSWKWSSLAWSSSNRITIYFCILPLCDPANVSSRKAFVLIPTLGKWQNAFDTVYRKKSFPSKESDTKILQSIYFAYYVGMFKVLFNFGSGSKWFMISVMKRMIHCSLHVSIVVQFCLWKEILLSQQRIRH